MQLSPNDRDVINIYRNLSNCLSVGFITQAQYDVYMERLKIYVLARLEEILPEEVI